MDTEPIDRSIPPKIKPLAVFVNADEKNKYKGVCSKNDKLKSIQREKRICKNEFGKKDKDDFSYVIFGFMDPKVNELMQEDGMNDYYLHYRSAPVACFVIPESQALQKHIED